jgi:hypothetical protein
LERRARGTSVAQPLDSPAEAAAGRHNRHVTTDKHGRHRPLLLITSCRLRYGSGKFPRRSNATRVFLWRWPIFNIHTGRQTPRELALVVDSNYNIRHVELYYMITTCEIKKTVKTGTEYGQLWPWKLHAGGVNNPRRTATIA